MNVKNAHSEFLIKLEEKLNFDSSSVFVPGRTIKDLGRT